MKTVYLLTKIGTNVIFDTIFSSKELAEEQLKNSTDEGACEFWEIIELKYK